MLIKMLVKKVKDFQIKKQELICKKIIKNKNNNKKIKNQVYIKLVVINKSIK